MVFSKWIWQQTGNEVITAIQDGIVDNILNVSTGFKELTSERLCKKLKLKIIKEYCTCHDDVTDHLLWPTPKESKGRIGNIQLTIFWVWDTILRLAFNLQ